MSPARRFAKDDSVHAVVAEIARMHGVEASAMRSPDRTDRVVAARNHAMAVLRFTKEWSLTRIGRHFGRDHSTVLFAIGSHLLRARVDHPYARAVAGQRVRNRDRKREEGR